MEIKQLSKENFATKGCMSNQPYVRFYRKGLIVLNKSAVKHLKLWDKKNGWGCVGIGVDIHSMCQSDFTITNDPLGWCLRTGTSGGAVFNNASLSRHVIDKTWERAQSHPVGCPKPLSCVFRIATVSLDEDKNKGVYALLRRRE